MAWTVESDKASLPDLETGETDDVMGTGSNRGTPTVSTKGCAIDSSGVYFFGYTTILDEGLLPYEHAHIEKRSLADGSLLWEKTVDQIYPSSSLDSQYVVFTDGTSVFAAASTISSEEGLSYSLWCFDKDTGEPVWIDDDTAPLVPVSICGDSTYIYLIGRDSSNNGYQIVRFRKADGDKTSLYAQESSFKSPTDAALYNGSIYITWRISGETTNTGIVIHAASDGSLTDSINKETTEDGLTDLTFISLDVDSSGIYVVSSQKAESESSTIQKVKKIDFDKTYAWRLSFDTYVDNIGNPYFEHKFICLKLTLGLTDSIFFGGTSNVTYATTDSKWTMNQVADGADIVVGGNVIGGGEEGNSYLGIIVKVLKDGTLVEYEYLTSAGSNGFQEVNGIASGETAPPSVPTLLRNPRLRFFDADDKPLVGGKLYLCPAGSTDISTLKASWQDYDKTVLNPNPIVLDSEGYSVPIFSDATYKVFLYSSQDELILSQDAIWSSTLGLLQFSAAQLQFWDSNGSPLVLGKLYTCKAGGSINELKASYSDVAQSILNDNPILLDPDGKASLIYTEELYKLFIFDSNDVPILSQDNVGPS